MRNPFFFVALSILLFTSCKEPVISGIDLDAQINLIVKDTLGLNLLDPSTPNHYNPDDIRLYYLVDGQKVEQYYPNLSSPRHFAVMRNESIDEYFIRIFLHDGTLNQEVTTTYIQWRKGDEDTIRSQIQRMPQSVRSSKVWFNDQLKYDQELSSYTTYWGNGIFRRLIEITK